jgi:flavin reductase (DIM6/NTAB) family NADH-FMN oxidoreductase RutF
MSTGDATAFTEIAGSLDYPMFVVTAAANGHQSGCLVGFVTQCSIDPPRLVVCISKANRTYEISAHASTLVVHVLRSDQLDLARRFGENTGDDVDKFARERWRPGPDGVPVLEGCDWIAGHVLERVDLGDHVGHVVDVRASGREHAPAPQLGYQATSALSAGHDA